MAVDRGFIEKNAAQTQRIRDLVAGLSEDQFQRQVGEHWTVAVALAHLAFWDRRVLTTLDLTEKAGKLVAPTIDVVVNDVSLPLWHAIPAQEAARLAIENAEALDKRLENYPPALLEEVAAFNPRYLDRALHRAEHLDEVDEVLKS